MADIQPFTADAAHNTCAILEVLELILLQLRIADLLRIQQVSRTMHDAVDASSRLLRELFLLPAEDAHLRLLPSLGRFDQDLLDKPIALTHEFDCTSVARNPTRTLNLKHRRVSVWIRQPLPQICPKARRMLISQPPTREMRMVVHCCTLNHRAALGASPNAVQTVRNENGITLGELHDVAECVLQRHENCAFAGPYTHRADGSVRAYVQFEGMVELRVGDPLMGVEGAFVRSRLRVWKEDLATEERMRGFVRRSGGVSTSLVLR